MLTGSLLTRPRVRSRRPTAASTSPLAGCSSIRHAIAVKSKYVPALLRFRADQAPCTCNYRLCRAATAMTCRVTVGRDLVPVANISRHEQRSNVEGVREVNTSVPLRQPDVRRIPHAVDVPPT